MPQPTKTLARLTIETPGARSPGEILTIACWLRKQAADYERGYAKYTRTGRFTARVLRTPKGLEAK